MQKSLGEVISKKNASGVVFYALREIAESKAMWQSKGIKTMGKGEKTGTGQLFRGGRLLMYRCRPFVKP